MSSLKVVSLGELCNFVNGGTPSKSVDHYFRGNIPWITGADITSPTVNTARSFITKEAIKNSATNLAPAGTVLLVTRTSVGKVALAGVSLCFSQDITAIFPDEKKLDAKYLVHFLKSQEVYFKQHQRGATIQGITREVLTQSRIPLPPLPEQRRIAAILDKADSLREKRRQAIVKLDELQKSVFIEMFGDPVMNPKGWERKALSEVGVLDRGRSKHRPRNAPELLGGPYPLIQTGDVANANSYIVKYTQTYSELGLKQSKMWKAGTLCITIAANIAKTAILTFDACFPDSVVGFIPNDLTTTEFIQHWLSFLQKTLEETAPESAQKNINLKILNELTLPLPPKSLQEEFTNIVKAVEALKSKYRQSYTKADELFQSLQQRAFSGDRFTEKTSLSPPLTEVAQHA